MDSSKYLVLDVETNGLSSVYYDLLSVTIYKPDTNDFFERFLPLELNEQVLTSDINGITTSQLKGEKPLTQEELDNLYHTFDFENRTILMYGNLDERFIRKYLERHNLLGIEKWHFFNFKRNIISSKFSGGIFTKDNFCELFGIKGVKPVHSGKNDCILEWKLFDAMQGKPLLCIGNRVFWFDEKYIVPASYLSNYPNFKYHTNVPKIKVQTELVKSFEIISGNELRKFPTNFNGIMIEGVINALINVEKQNNRKALSDNLKQLQFIGSIQSSYKEIPIYVENDGTITFYRPEDRELAISVNEQIGVFKKTLQEMVRYLKKEIFQDEVVMSQELVINKTDRVLAVCDLSTSNVVVEIKTFDYDKWDNYAIQLYYQSAGRRVYCLTTNWDHYRKKTIYFNLYKIEFETKERKTWAEYQEVLKKEKEIKQQEYQNLLTCKSLQITTYRGYKKPVDILCTVCGNTFTRLTTSIRKNPDLICPYCGKKKTKSLIKDEHVAKDSAMKEKEKSKSEARITNKRHRKDLSSAFVASYSNLPYRKKERGNSRG